MSVDGQGAGVGGLGRGPGAAELLWGGEPLGREQTFRSEALPAAQVRDPAASVPVGIGLAAPELDVERDAPAPGGAEAALGEAAWGRRLAPRHRRTVERWFAPASARDGR